MTDSDFHIDIKVGDVAGVNLKGSLYSVSLYVANNKVAESTNAKAPSPLSVIRWNTNNQM